MAWPPKTRALGLAARCTDLGPGVHKDERGEGSIGAARLPEKSDVFGDKIGRRREKNAILRLPIMGADGSHWVTRMDAAGSVSKVFVGAPSIFEHFRGFWVALPKDRNGAPRQVSALDSPIDAALRRTAIRHKTLRFKGTFCHGQDKRFQEFRSRLSIMQYFCARVNP